MDSTDTAITPGRESGPATLSVDSKATIDTPRRNKYSEQARPPYGSRRSRDSQRGRGGGRQRKSEMGRTEWR